MVLFTLCWISTQSSPGCNIPPRFWCTSPDVAHACQVTRQCDAWSQPETNAPKVNFALYYETLCPDCKEFTAGQLSPVFFKIGDIMNLDLVPYGNAMQKQVGDKWEFTCQHGPMECLGNLIQTCAIHIIGNMSRAYPFVGCMEGSEQTPNISGLQCAKQFGIDYKAILNCVDGPLGNKLEHEMAVKTEKLDPPHAFVPWVTLNSVHTDEIQLEAEVNLLKLICDTYKGTKPDVCFQESAVHKSLNVI